MRECEEMLKFVQSSWNSQLELADGSRLTSYQMMHTSEACKEDEQSRQLEHYNTVRLNLINHLIGFIPTKFACISTISNPVFRWDSCKGSE